MNLRDTYARQARNSPGRSTAEANELSREAVALAETVAELRSRPNVIDREIATRIAKQFARRVYRGAHTNGIQYVMFLRRAGFTEAEL